MKKTILALVVVLTTAGTIYVTAQSSSVIVCHRIVTRGKRLYQNLSLAPNQVAAHLQHGDVLDSCKY